MERMEIPPEVKKRFWGNVRKTKSCWTWKGWKSTAGYGLIAFKGIEYTTHRFSMMMLHGDFSSKKWVLHKCDNPPCVNPSHLYFGTPKENTGDRDKRGRSVYFRGDKNGNSKLTTAQAVFIKSNYSKKKRNGVKLARKFGIHSAVVYRISKGQNWKHITSKTRIKNGTESA